MSELNILSDKTNIHHYNKFKLNNGNLYMNNKRVGITTYTTGHNIEISDNIFDLTHDISINNSITISDKIFLYGDRTSILKGDLSINNLYAEKVFSNYIEISGLIVGSGEINTSYSAAFGFDTSSCGVNSIASGFKTVSNNNNSISSGYLTQASGENSFAGGFKTMSMGNNSFTMGNNTISDYNNLCVIGKYNDVSQNALFVIGNGVVGHRSDIMVVDNSNVTINGNVLCNNIEISNNLHINGSILYNILQVRDLSINGNFIATSISCENIQVSNKINITNTEVNIENTITTIGDNLISKQPNSLTIGNYNDISENALFVVGNGNTNNRSDSMYIDISGNLYIKYKSDFINVIQKLIDISNAISDL